MMRKSKFLVWLALFIILAAVLTTVTLFFVSYGDYTIMVAIGLIIGLVIGIPTGALMSKEWTLNAMKAGAQIAIDASNSNDRNDATKIKALADLTRETVKAHSKALPNGQGFPPLPPSSFTEASFTIEGLED